MYPTLSEGRPGLLGAITTRAEAQTVRLALLYALLDQSVDIKPPHLHAALAVWRYCQDSAQYIFGNSLGDSTADAILNLLRSSGEGITRNELTDHFKRNKPSAEIGRALAVLQSHGLVRLERRETGGRTAATGKIGLWLRAMFEVGYTYGWRHEELLALRVRQVNPSVGSIRLEPRTTKNDQGREVSMTLPVRVLLTQCIQGKAPDDFVFTREDGKPVRDFRGAWASACESAKVSGLLFHDRRRTRGAKPSSCGVAEGVIMKIGGWKTRSVFERYAIVSQSDIRDAMAKLEAGQQQDNADAAQEQESEQVGQSLGRATSTKRDSEIPSARTTSPVN